MSDADEDYRRKVAEIPREKFMAQLNQEPFPPLSVEGHIFHGHEVMWLGMEGAVYDQTPEDNFVRRSKPYCLTCKVHLEDPGDGGERVVTVIQTRVHDRDMAGQALSPGGFEHLHLPSEYDGFWVDVREAYRRLAHVDWAYLPEELLEKIMAEDENQGGEQPSITVLKFQAGEAPAIYLRRDQADQARLRRTAAAYCKEYGVERVQIDPVAMTEEEFNAIPATIESNRIWQAANPPEG